MITVELILDNEPCNRYDSARIENIIGEGKSIEEYIDLDISLFDKPEDKFWTFARCEVLPAELLYEISIHAAELALPIWEKIYPNDKSRRNTIKARKKWLKSGTPDDDLQAIRYNAYAVAYGAAVAAASVAGDKIYDKLYDFIKLHKGEYKGEGRK